ncbi:MAG: CpsD/CapB family tyrosine-protein kinase [Oleiphilaceae bacterium]|nr:CpsD/CapB family tyrosine-protein kinase [Oleiphilaceae bacterium]
MERIKQAVVKMRRESDSVAVQAEQCEKGESEPRIGKTIVYRRTRIVPFSLTNSSRDRIVAADPGDPRRSQFGVLRTKVLQEMEKNGWRTLAITSPRSGCGKTVVAINLAIKIAQMTDRTALLVDFDFRRPQVANYLGITEGYSLADVLHGRADVADALVNPDMPRLLLMPMYQPEPNSAELLSSSGVGDLIAELRTRYTDRVVIFDLPPLLGSDDAIAVLPKIDCVLLVVGDRESSWAEIEESMEHLSSASFLGTVLNKN